MRRDVFEAHHVILSSASYLGVTDLLPQPQAFPGIDFSSARRWTRSCNPPSADGNPWPSFCQLQEENQNSLHFSKRRAVIPIFHSSRGGNVGIPFHNCARGHADPFVAHTVFSFALAATWSIVFVTSTRLTSANSAAQGFHLAPLQVRWRCIPSFFSLHGRRLLCNCVTQCAGLLDFGILSSPPSRRPKHTAWQYRFFLALTQQMVVVFPGSVVPFPFFV